MDRMGMDKDLLHYERMVEDALRGVLREVIARVAQLGLPGGHSLYITFRSGDPGVGIPDSLRAQYPDTMTIVLEHQFWDLAADDDCFAVTLSFKGRRQKLTVPYAAITAFHDPGVQFGLRFDQLTVTGGEKSASAAKPPVPAPVKGPSSPSEPQKKSGDVVSLDSFRKK